MAEQRLVIWQDLPNVIKAEWSHLAYEDRWRRCAGCRAWGMLFVGDAFASKSMDEHPLTTVVQMACPVTDHDPKVMCKVYQLRRLMKIIFEVSDSPTLQAQKQALMMTVADFIIEYRELR